MNNDQCYLHLLFTLTMIFTFVYDRKNEYHWSLLIIRYSLLVIIGHCSLLGVQTPQ